LRPDTDNCYPGFNNIVFNELLELFESGNIDWKTLQKCVYKDTK
jgi:DNA-binding ferritin-like protein (Dps family)